MLKLSSLDAQILLAPSPQPILLSSKFFRQSFFASHVKLLRRSSYYPHNNFDLLRSEWPSVIILFTSMDGSCCQTPVCLCIDLLITIAVVEITEMYSSTSCNSNSGGTDICSFENPLEDEQARRIESVLRWTDRIRKAYDTA